MLQAMIKRPDELTVSERDAWRALAATSRAFASPLLTPEFAEVVGRVRPDAAVALFRRRREIVGVLAHHRRPNGAARPLGGPWSDVQGLIAEPDAALDWRTALAAASLRSYRAPYAIDPHGLFADAAGLEQPAHLVDYALGEAGEAYWERLRAGSPKRFKNIRRLEHKLEREFGRLEIGPDRSPQALDLLLGWKRRQLAATASQDVLHASWSRALMAETFALQDEAALQGLLITLRAGGRVVAGHFGVRAGAVFHPWIAAYDPALAANSPGLVFMSQAVRAAPRLGIARYELSAGSDHYKTAFASGAQAVRRVEADLRPPRAPSGPVLRRVLSRLDRIAEVEPTWAGRLHGLMRAVADARRLAKRPAATLCMGACA